MSKTIEEIKDEYAINLAGYNTWDELINDEPSYRVEIHTDQVAERYAQSQTHELTNWKESMMKIHSELDLQGIGAELGLPLGSSIAPQVLPKIKELKEHNAELVEMLKHLYELTEYFDEWEEERQKMNEVLTELNQM